MTAMGAATENDSGGASVGKIAGRLRLPQGRGHQLARQEREQE